MFKRIQNIIITLSLSVTLFVFCVPADPARAEDKNSLFIVELINWIRMDPVRYAESLGYDRAAVLQVSFLASRFSNGINLFALSDFLMEKAAFDNAEFPVGDGPAMTVLTDYADTGDVNGTVIFANFMDPLQAVRVIVDDQFVKELDPFYTGTRYILSNTYNNIGASLRDGRLTIESGIRNAYFVKICFGSSLLRSEVQVVSMINQLRAAPQDAHKYIALNTWFLAGDYHPLFINRPLSVTAQVSLSEAVDYDEASQDYGYEGDGVVESSVFETFPHIEADLYAKVMFSSLVLREAKEYPGKNSIFHPNYNTIGLATYYVGGADYDFSKLSAVAGILSKDSLGMVDIYGVLYVDADGNGCYGPGEELANREVAVYETSAPESVFRPVSNNAGYFSISLPVGGQYVFQSDDAHGRGFKTMTSVTDQFLGVVVEPVTDVTMAPGSGK